MKTYTVLSNYEISKFVVWVMGIKGNFMMKILGVELL